MPHRPTFDEFAALARGHTVVPVYRRLTGDTLTPVSAFCKLQEGDWSFLFESVVGGERVSRYSFLGAGPFRMYTRVILPTLSTQPGVAQVTIFGSQPFAVRVDADLDQLAARNLGLPDVQAAIARANANTAVGSISEAGRNVILDATGPLGNAAGFKPVIVTWQNGAPVRLQDVATVTDGVANDKIGSWLNGKPGEILAVFRQPDANTVDTVDKVKAALPSIQASLPPGVVLEVLQDRSLSIRASINDVMFSLGLAVLLPKRSRGPVGGMLGNFLSSPRLRLVHHCVMTLS